MDFTRTTVRKFIKFLLAGLLTAVIVGYAIWRVLNYARGPEIIVSYPIDGDATSSPYIKVTGIAERITKISLNGRQITIDEFGNFSEPLVIFQGINVITFAAEDQFGRSITKEVRMLGN